MAQLIAVLSSCNLTIDRLFEWHFPVHALGQDRGTKLNECRLVNGQHVPKLRRLCSKVLGLANDTGH